MAKTVKVSLGNIVREEKSKVQVEIKGKQLCITGLPDDDVLEYVATTNNFKYFVVHRPRENWSYADFRLHIGLESDLREAEVSCVERLGNSGTTYIDYYLNGKHGRLYFPSRLDEGEEPGNYYDPEKEILERLV